MGPSSGLRFSAEPLHPAHTAYFKVPDVLSCVLGAQLDVILRDVRFDSGPEEGWAILDHTNFHVPQHLDAVVLFWLDAFGKELTLSVVFENTGSTRVSSEDAKVILRVLSVL